LQGNPALIRITTAIKMQNIGKERFFISISNVNMMLSFDFTMSLVAKPHWDFFCRMDAGEQPK